MAELHVFIRGMVQGVGFRWFVREQGRRLALAGWVRNHADGRVEVAASGDDAAIGELRQLLARGPDGAHVTGVDDQSGNFDSSSLPHPFAVHR